MADRRAFNPGQPRSRTVSARLRKTHLKTIHEHTKTKSEGTLVLLISPFLSIVKNLTFETRLIFLFILINPYVLFGIVSHS